MAKFSDQPIRAYPRINADLEDSQGRRMTKADEGFLVGF